MFVNNHGDSPEEVRNYWQNTSSLVQDEVNRISGLLRERHPFTRRPIHLSSSPFNKGCFEFKLPRNADKNFVDQVLNHYRELGWTATVKSSTDMGGCSEKLLLRHPLFEENDNAVEQYAEVDLDRIHPGDM